MMNEHGKSDSCIVPTKPPNKDVASHLGSVHSRRRRWREGGWPRAIRTSKPCSGRSAGLTCHMSLSGYGKQQRFGVMTQGRSPVR
jgi:hypothetical protein